LGYTDAVSVIGEVLLYTVGIFCLHLALIGAFFAALWILASTVALLGRVHRVLIGPELVRTRDVQVAEPCAEPVAPKPAVVAAPPVPDLPEDRSFLWFLAAYSLVYAGGAVAWREWHPRATPENMDAGGAAAVGAVGVLAAVVFVGFALVLNFGGRGSHSASASPRTR
jgi:hypothetical protein